VQQTMHSCVDYYQVICISHQSICGSGLHYARGGGGFWGKKGSTGARKGKTLHPFHLTGIFDTFLVHWSSASVKCRSMQGKSGVCAHSRTSNGEPAVSGYSDTTTCHSQETRGESMAEMIF
jgi:hypothetical protein